ncbi:DUF4129 domain-containing protein [Paenibacillus lemnae]|uniref:DUF4129 domain-containing protein n=1 Tax=Paenibacillus lemnae TaxID=1330551 RepID=A0A848MB88_PAELE|nr:DUF4129 domain-containing protein [Paenibacillus lemnae]NMO97786.1 DUF4129 domain-containing protein [Paenibacillus lemnae]
MKNQFGMVRILGQATTECLIFFPLLYIPFSFMGSDIGDILIVASIVLAGYITGWMADKYMKLNTLFKAASMAIIFSVSMSLLIWGLSLQTAAAGLFWFIAFYRGVRMGQEHWFSLFPGRDYLIGLIIYAVSSFILQYMPEFEPYSNGLTWLGAAALIVTLLQLNRRHVEDSTLPGSEPPALEKRVRHQNQGMIWFLITCIALLVLLPVLRNGAEQVWNSMVTWMSGLIDRSPVQEDDMVPPNLQEMTPMLPIEEEPPPPPAWLVWLENMVKYIVYIAMGGAVLFLLYYIFTKMPSWFSALSAWLNRLRSRQSPLTEAGAYEDEVERIKPARMGKHRKRRSVLRKKSEDDGMEHDLKTLIRMWYRSLLERKIREGYVLQKHLTPRETADDLESKDQTKAEPIPEELVEYYEQARYGNKELDPRTMKEIQKALKTR